MNTHRETFSVDCQACRSLYKKQEFEPSEDWKLFSPHRGSAPGPYRGTVLQTPCTASSFFTSWLQLYIHYWFSAQHANVPRSGTVGGRGSGASLHLSKFWAVQKNSQNLLVGKFLAKSAKFESEKSPFGKIHRKNWNCEHIVGILLNICI